MFILEDTCVFLVRWFTLATAKGRDHILTFFGKIVNGRVTTFGGLRKKMIQQRLTIGEKIYQDLIIRAFSQEFILHKVAGRRISSLSGLLP